MTQRSDLEEETQVASPEEEAQMMIPDDEGPQRKMARWRFPAKIEAEIAKEAHAEEARMNN